MSINPYQSPTDTDTPVAEMLPDRAATLRMVHRAVLVLAFPAAANFVCWTWLTSLSMFAGYPEGFIAFTLFSVVLLLMACWLIWTGGLTILEYAAVAIHFIFGGSISREQWLSVMYRSLWTLKWVAPAGAVVWLIWLLLIYGLRVNFMVASVPLGIIAHLLGACVYLTIFYNWYRARRP